MGEYFCPRCENEDVVTLGPILYCPECDLQLAIFNFDSIIEEVNQLNEINRSTGFSIELLDEKLGLLVNLYRYVEATEICENIFNSREYSPDSPVYPMLSNHIRNILYNDDVPDDIVCRLEILKARIFMVVAEMGYKEKLGDDELFEATCLFFNYREMNKDTLRCLDLMLKRDGPNKEWLDVMAQIYYDRYDYERSLNYYDQSAILDSNDFWLWFNKTRIYIRIDDYDKALECAAIAINTKDSDFKYVPNLFNILGLDYNPVNVEYLNECYQSYSNSISEMDSICENACNLLDNNRFYDAIIEYDKCVSISEDFSDIWFNKGLAHYHLQQYEEAIFCMDKTLEINERDSKAWALKAASLLATEEYRDSKYNAKKALEYDKNDLTAKDILEFFKINPLAAL